MLFSSYIVIRTTSSWMRSCPITRFDTKKANVKELPNFESCSSPAPWGLLVFWILETVPHCVPRPKNSCSQSFPHALSASATVGSTACTCVLDSLYSPWDDTLPHWRCPSLQQVDCERSAASTIFSQRLLLNVQNLSRMQHFGRVRSVSCHTSCESVVHCLSAPLSESSHQAYTSHAVNDRTSFSSAKVVTLRESPLSLANNTKIWAPRQCQRRAMSAAAQHRTTTMLINLGSRVPFTDSFPVCQATRRRWLCTPRSSFCWEKEWPLKLFSSSWRLFEQKLCSPFCTEMIRPDRA